ncbi:MAG: hypothetical protein AAGC43_04700 [Bacteroidota bacterium]
MDRIIIQRDDNSLLELDMYPKTSVNLNVQVNTIGDLGTRNSSFSNTFIIPKTPTNMLAFDYAGVSGNISRKPYQVIRCSYLIDTFNVFRNGYIKLIESPNDKEYRVAVFDGILDLGVILGEKRINELDFSQFDHLLSMQSFIDSFQNTEGYIYGVAEFGKTVNNSYISIDKQAPSLFAKTIWDKIFNENGLTYTGVFFEEDAEWPLLVMPPTKGIDVVQSGLTETNIGTSTSQLLDESEFYTEYFGEDRDPFVFNNDGFGPEFSVSGGNIISNYDGTIRINFTTTYTTNGSTAFRVRIKINGEDRALYTPYLSPSPVTREIILDISSGDIIQFEGSGERTASTWPPDGFSFSYDATVAVNISTITGGVYIPMNDYVVTDLKQIDFVKDILQRFGLIMTRDAIDPQNYIFTRIQDVLNDRENAQDWSSKLINIGKEKYRSNYAQENTMAYKYTADAIPVYDGIMTVDDKNLSPSKILWTSPYQIPELSTINWGIFQHLNIPIWRELENGNIENVETEVKLMRLVYNTSGFTFRLFEQGSTNVSDPVPLLRLNNMTYTSIIGRYYQSLNDLLDNYKEVDVEVNLSITDYGGLDLTRLVYLKQTGRFYLIDSVRIRPNKTTAKLLEITNFDS